MYSVSSATLSAAVWRKSSRSGGNGGQCVEVASNLPGIVAIRDSKDPSGPVLVVETTAFRAFAATVKSL
ncbi:DUF397 domain-containing protein [Actinocatenispora comari]|jgi:hypothetical protein|uniref:DUF397 domain-containing protein n=1 Tax=Actinocatenispora comari TaxID=2807577 RepID=A0A8J4EIJ0_9ACTN|nr:DUF397 domain-containing protein [Actinocatenispora comari]GIL25000.1 hypothetical protein NUM_02550 [Actinocatenispora comari]